MSELANQIAALSAAAEDRVARAIWMTSHTFAQLDESGDTFDGLPDYAQEHYFDLARAAISALRAADEAEALRARVAELRESLELADAMLRGANMNRVVCERKISKALGDKP